MSRRGLIAGTLVMLAGIGIWMNPRSDSQPRISGQPREVKSIAPPPREDNSAALTPEEPPPPVQAPAPATPEPRSKESRMADRRDFENPLVPADAAETPRLQRAPDAGPEVAADFDKIYRMLRDYRTLTGENPVGTNAEMMKSIMGDNPKGARLGPPEGQRVNEKGELIDRWGSPYFFHQLTKDMMEIRSGGPDRILWNEDDIISD